jgi:pyroglutamyl-peptidase
VTVLVTGFEPFGGSTVNPSRQLVEALDGDVAKAVLPVSYARAASALREAIAEHEPDVVICFGQADGRTGISIERFAHNLDEATTTDNEEAPGSGAPIDPDGPVAYPSSLPVDDIVAALREDGIPAAPSRDAGGFLCNHVFYVLMRTLEDRGGRGGFVHVPLLLEQALDKDSASMPRETLVRAAEIIVATARQRAGTDADALPSQGR